MVTAPTPPVRVNAGSATAPVPVPTVAAAPSPEAAKRIAEVRTRIHAAVGQVVLALSVVPRYRHQTLGGLQTLVLEPLLRDRVAIATERADAKSAPEVSGKTPTADAQSNTGALAGIAFWSRSVGTPC